MNDDDILLEELDKELKKLKNVPPLPPHEQKIIDALGKAMAEQALADEARGIRHKRVKRKKR